MENIWDLANVERTEFAAAASLLAITTQGRSISSSEQPCAGEGNDSTDEETEDWVTVTPSAGLHRIPRSNLKDKFLNRLAELLARDKSAAQGLSRMDSKHVAAAAWIKGTGEEPATILIAKNEGLDDRDRRMLDRLEMWLRVIASTGRVPDVQSDHLWVGSSQWEGLLEYYRNRLEFYISLINQLGSAVGPPSAEAGENGPTVAHLQSLCRDFNQRSTPRQLGDIVGLAYAIRYTPWSLNTNTKAAKAILMLGRLRAIYESLKSAALTFSDFKTMRIMPATVPHHMNINTTKFRKQLREYADNYSSNSRILKTKQAQRYTGASRLHVHAEMQVLMSVESDLSWQRRAHPYIGTSRKPCYLCHEFINKYTKLTMTGDRAPNFRTRASHGKVYPLWSLPSFTTVAQNRDLSLASALLEVFNETIRHLGSTPSLQPAIAESSAGVTQSGVHASGTSRLMRQYLATQRPSDCSTAHEATEDKVPLGPKVKTVLVARFPADGKDPDLFPITFYSLPDKEDRRIREIPHMTVPNFKKFWGASQFTRRFRKLLRNEADQDAPEGYNIYWSEDPELPENEYVKRLLGLERIDAARRFWYGDVFFVRFSEHPKTFAFDVYDAELAALRVPEVGAFFKEMWDEQFLEHELEYDKYFETQMEKKEADAAIILERMYVCLVSQSSMRSTPS